MDEKKKPHKFLRYGSLVLHRVQKKALYLFGSFVLLVFIPKFLFVDLDWIESITFAVSLFFLVSVFSELKRSDWLNSALKLRVASLISIIVFVLFMLGQLVDNFLAPISFYILGAIAIMSFFAMGKRRRTARHKS